MGILSKLFTAVRGGAREAGEAVVDMNAIRIFEQEIVDARNALDKAKRSLTEVMANEMQTKRKISALNESIAEHEGYAAQALEKGNEPLALEIAEKIAEFENEKEEQEAILGNFTASVAQLKSQIKEAEKTIKENQRQLSIVKTTDSVQKATMAVNTTLSNNSSSMSSAKASLERIKKRQQDQADQLKAAQELHDESSGANLKSKMEEAGIGGSKSSGSDVLARLKSKQ